MQIYRSGYFFELYFVLHNYRGVYMKKLLLFIAVTATAFFTACSSDSGSGSSGADCSDGFSKNCLKGTWYMPGLYVKGSDGQLGATPAFTFSTPDVLTLSVKHADVPTAEEDFEMVFSNSDSDANGNTNSEAACGTMYGKWFISGTNTIHVTSNSDCAFKNGATTADIKVTSVTSDTLTLDSAYFHSSTILVSHQKTFEKFHR